MVSIRKIAGLAGVSHVAVWRAMRGKPGVNPALRERILALAAAHHCRSPRQTEESVPGKTRTIGLIIENVASHFYSRVCHGVMDAAFQDQVYVMTLNMVGVNGEPRQLPLLVAQLIEQRVTGIVIATGKVPVSAKVALEMWSHDIVPVLLNDTPSEKPLDRVETDEHRVAQLALEYLLHLGHRRIVYCGFDPLCARNHAMKEAFRARGISLEFFIEKAHIYPLLPERVEAYLDAFFRSPAPPTAIICYNDHMATQLLLCAQRRGLRVPGDLSILGCGNDHIGCALLTPPLTSIEQHPEALGTHAYAMIQRRHREEEAPGARIPETIFIPPELVMRASCAPLHAREPVYSTTEVTTDVYPKLARILAACSGTMRKQELMARLGLRNEKHFRVAYLTPALASGYLERTIPDKPRSSQQCYQLTAKGQQEKGLLLL